MEEMQSMFAQYGWLCWIVSLALLLLLAGWLSVLQRRLALLARRSNAVLRTVDGHNLDEVFSKHIDLIYQNRASIEQLTSMLEEIQRSTAQGIQRIGFVRFSSYLDTGGDQSFALALLSESNDGIMIMSLHARNGSRIYAKPIQDGQSLYPLSKEEEEALRKAMQPVRHAAAAK